MRTQVLVPSMYEGLAEQLLASTRGQDVMAVAVGSGVQLPLVIVFASLAAAGVAAAWAPLRRLVT